MTATTPSGPSTPSDAVPAVEATPVWKRPKWVLAGIGTLVLLGLMWRYGGGNVRFSTDLRPKPNTTFDWDYFWALVPDMLRGLFLTVQATLLGFAIALVLGLFLAVGRRSRIKLISWPITFLIEFIRSTPLLIQLFFLYYALPDWDITLASLTTLVLGLGIHYATYCSEAYRAGINSVPIGQWEASTAVNFGRVTTWTSVILPQAIPNALPALGNYLVAAFKDAPLGFAIGVTGLLTAAQSINREGYTPGTEEYAVVGVAFLAVSIPAAWLIRRLERKIAYERID